jgi:hypothetical protein
MAVDLNQVTEAYPGWQARWGAEQLLFAAQGNDLEFSLKSDKIPADGFGQPVKNTLPGMAEASLKAKGMAAMEKGASTWQMRQWQGRKSPVNTWWAMQGGLQLLQPMSFMPASVNDTSTTAKLKDPVDASYEFDARGAYYDGTILLSPWNLLVGASGSGSVDLNTLYGGATTSGGAGVLHVWAYDGGTTPSVTVTIQHSPDGTTYTNLVSFAAQTTLGSQLIKVPSGITINPYVQAIWTTSGTPTDVQVLCGFARVPNLNV